MPMSDLKEYEELLLDEAAQDLFRGESEPWKELPSCTPTMDFPVKCLTPVLQNIVNEVADSVQVSSEMVACAALGVLSIACLGTSVYIRQDYSEPTQLYILISAAPSERKSAVLSILPRPINDLARSINKYKKEEKDRNDLKRAMLKKSLDKALAKGKESEARSIQAQMDEIPDVKLFLTPYTDITMEALAIELSVNGGTGSIVTDEGALFNVLSGAYSQDPNIDVILQGYTGGRIHVGRVGRDTVSIERAMLAILVAVQPQVLERLLSNEVLLGRGLCTRFLYSRPKSLIGHRNARTSKPVSADTAERYNHLIQRLAQQSFEGAQREIHMDEQATELYYQWAEEVERNVGPGALWNGVANGWESKLVGNTIRIAGLLKMADSPNSSHPINYEHFSSAIEIARYFVDQALALTGKASGLTPAAREVLEEILAQSESPFSPYNLRQKLRYRKSFKEGAKVDQALACLAKAGYIRLTLPPPYAGTGRRPEATYEVHPDLLNKGV